MWLFLLSVLLGAAPALPLNLDYLDPTKLQTVRSAQIQERAAFDIIKRYFRKVTVEINAVWFRDKKDVFHIKTYDGFLHIRASSGVAAVWGFNYYLKKYCKSQIEWQTKNVRIPKPMPEADEAVIANDRFRYYQNSCTVSYSFVWWNIEDWKKHLKWMALNGINLTLAPVAQEAIWARIYKQMGMTQEEIDKHFTGPAFLSWLRLGNIHGWGGPLPKSWHELQMQLQTVIINSMLNLGMVPILPAFNGHVPVAFSRLYPNSSFYRVKAWKNFTYDYCCDLFVDPYDPLFKLIGTEFLKEMGKNNGCHIYFADSFNEVVLSKFDTNLVTETARNIFFTISDFNDNAVWLLHNWIFVNPSVSKYWPKERVKSFLRAVPNGRILILDLQAERLPKYDIYNMYFGQPFIWCMLHNFGGTLGMFGNMVTINNDVYIARDRAKSTMIGIGLTPEGINQNYVVYDLMLESAWRKSPVQDLDAWVAEYAERRYGCNATAGAWKYLLKSVYSYKGLGIVDGLNTVTRKPSFSYKPWAWYRSADLFEAFRRLVSVTDNSCDSNGYRYDVVDVTRQALQYRIEQLFVKMVFDAETDEFKLRILKFLDAFDDMALILAADVNFRASKWFSKARALGKNSDEADLYEYNAWNQITRWGPSGQVNDYACKQWSEMVSHYYRPGWAKFLKVALRAKDKKKNFRGHALRDSILLEMSNKTVLRGDAFNHPERQPYNLAKFLYSKWVSVPGLHDLHIEMPAEEKSVRNVETNYYESEYERE